MSSERPRPAPASESEYDGSADIYEIWTDSATAISANRAFYIDVHLAADGPIVELSVGDGRIAVEAATRGCTVTGVDHSSAMLDRCRERAERAGARERLTPVQADFRNFVLEEPAGLITLPYHRIGHLTTVGDKRDALRHIFGCLRPGGQFVFDDFFMTPALATHMRGIQLRTGCSGSRPRSTSRHRRFRSSRGRMSSTRMEYWNTVGTGA
jgi:ubiquinone/menaquinone biosynthesis C-methylase UbiE